MGDSFNSTGYCRTDRVAMTARLRDAIDACGGWIVDCHLFSNLSVCLNFEMGIERLFALGEALRAAGLIFTAKTETFLTSLRSEEATGMVSCTLQVTFVHREADLRVKVPAVP